MKRRACILYGSPHENGNTFKLLNYFMKFLPDFSVSWVNAYKENIRACVDCGVCKGYKRCVYRDMDSINNLLNNTELYIIASPIYNASFPAPLKSIFDRLQPYYYSRKEILTSKSAVLLMSQGSGNVDYDDVIAKQIKPIIRILGAKLSGILTLKDTDNPNLDIDKFYIKSENKIGEIISKINNKT